MTTSIRIALPASTSRARGRDNQVRNGERHVCPASYSESPHYNNNMPWSAGDCIASGRTVERDVVVLGDGLGRVRRLDIHNLGGAARGSALVVVDPAPLELAELCEKFLLVSEMEQAGDAD